LQDVAGAAAPALYVAGAAAPALYVAGAAASALYVAGAAAPAHTTIPRYDNRPPRNRVGDHEVKVGPLTYTADDLKLLLE